jgi:hypothetical protein
LKVFFIFNYPCCVGEVKNTTPSSLFFNSLDLRREMARVRAYP